MTDKNGLNEKQIECIGRVVDRWINYQAFIKKVPGLSVGIVHDGKVILSKGYGYADVDRKLSADTDTGYRIASISKVFSAISIMQLVEQKKLRLDDLVSDHLDWFADKNITTRQLLTHSAGMDRDGDSAHWEDDVFPDLERLRRIANENVGGLSTLERFKYSNVGYSLIGQIIEKVSGVSYEEYVRENILSKLGMNNTFVDFSESAGKLAVGYGRDLPNLEREVFPNPKTGAMAPAAGFVSNVDDLCKFISAQFLDSELLLSKESKKEMQRTHWAEDGEDHLWGLGYEISKVGDHKIVGHAGAFPGFITKLGIDQKRKLGVVVLGNAIDFSAVSIFNGIFHIINHVEKSFDKSDSLKEKGIDPRKYEGLFHSRWCDVEVVEINDSLSLIYPSSGNPFEGAFKLSYESPSVFKIEGKDGFDYVGEKAVFDFDSSGKVRGLKVGPNPLIPFDEFMQRYK